MSHVTFHVSHVTCHNFFLQSGEISRLRVCYQRGLLRLVLVMTTSPHLASIFPWPLPLPASNDPDPVPIFHFLPLLSG